MIGVIIFGALVIAGAISLGFQAVFDHANVSVPWHGLSPLRHSIVTPNVHQWRHSQDQAALDRNHTAHYAFLGNLIGTAVKSDQIWPEKHGVLGDYVPNVFVKQFKPPFILQG